MTRIVPTIMNLLTALRTGIYDFHDTPVDEISVTNRSSTQRHPVTVIGADCGHMRVKD